MSRHVWLKTSDVHDAFATEIQAAGGTVLEAFDDGNRLFARSVLPRLEEVRPRDNVQGGAALRAAETGVWVYPYVYRVVCRTGPSGRMPWNLGTSKRLIFLIRKKPSRRSAKRCKRAALRGCLRVAPMRCAPPAPWMPPT